MFNPCSHFILVACLIGMIALCGPIAFAGETKVATLSLENLDQQLTWPEPTRRLVTAALELTTKNLGYQFGSANPAAGGMDCSGTVYRALLTSGWKNPPRSADAIMEWVKAAGLFTPVTGTPTLEAAVLSRLSSGDLLFWSGTYAAGERLNPASHVMIYLGKTKAGKPVMVGASDGRPYEGVSQCGVSVFDFKMPAATGKSRFIGYGPPPPPNGKLPKK